MARFAELYRGSRIRKRANRSSEIRTITEFKQTSAYPCEKIPPNDRFFSFIVSERRKKKIKDGGTVLMAHF